MSRMNFSPVQRLASNTFATRNGGDEVHVYANLQRELSLKGNTTVQPIEALDKKLGQARTSRDLHILITESPEDLQRAHEVNEAGGFVHVVSSDPEVREAYEGIADAAFDTADDFGEFWQDVSREVVAIKFRYENALTNARNGQGLAPVGTHLAL